jgi:hypothetical protein
MRAASKRSAKLPCCIEAPVRRPRWRLDRAQLRGPALRAGADDETIARHQAHRWFPKTKPE